MPTYQYRCTECGRKFETVLSIREHDRGRSTCPKCESKKVEQVPATVHVTTSRKS